MKNDVLIHVYLEKKFLLAFRFLMIFVALYFLWPIYNAFDKGYIIAKGSKSSMNDMSFYSFVFKDLLIAALFIWLGTGGAERRNLMTRANESGNDQNRLPKRLLKNLTFPATNFWIGQIFSTKKIGRNSFQQHTRINISRQMR